MFDYTHTFDAQIKKKIEHMNAIKEERQIGKSWMEVRTNIWDETLIFKCWNRINNDARTSKTMKRQIHIVDGKDSESKIKNVQQMNVTLNEFFNDIKDRFSC